MNGNKYKIKLTKSKSSTKKHSYKYFQNKKPLKNIDNNTSYASSDADNNSVNDIKNNDSGLKKNELAQNNENNINLVNKNDFSLSDGLTLNRGFQSLSQNNIFTSPNRFFSPNNLEQLAFAKVTKLNYDPLLDSRPNIIGNQNMINNNYQILNNNINPNNNINQIHNLNILNQNHLLNNNNILFINNNSNQQLNNNLLPNTSIISQILPIRIGIGYNVYNTQNNYNNAIQSRLTNIPTVNPYTLGNNINAETERLTIGYKVFNRENNLLKYQNNLTTINYPNSPRNNLNQNSTNIGENIINNNITINQPINPSDNFTNQITNYNYEAKAAETLNNNLLNNNDNNLKIPSIRDTIVPNNRETIIPNNNNIITNNSYPLNNIGNNNFSPDITNANLTQNIIPITNQIFNQNTTTPEININNILNNPTSINEPQKNNLPLNNILNQFENNNQNTNLYMNSIQKDLNIPSLRLTQSNNNFIEPQNNYLNKFFKNYTQPPQNQMFPQDNNYSQRAQNNSSEDGITIKDFGVLSRPGKDEYGMTKTNQDTFIAKRNINNINNFNIFGVLDGHGIHGHLISQFASQSIPNKIINNPEIQMNSNIESIYNILIRNDYQIIKQAYISTDNQLKFSNFDCKESGTTCCLVIHIGTHLICANVGDSRAIVVYDEQNDNNLNFLNVIPLSIDYKPELPEEKARIIMSGGTVEQIRYSFGMDAGPYRVFLAGKDYPGLAMSRSIGDLVGKQCGIIAEPGIREYNLEKNTKFLILCSDGVWEFLSNEKVRDIAKQFYLNSNAKELCQELISSSVIEWQTQDMTIDDITAEVIFF